MKRRLLAAAIVTATALTASTQTAAARHQPEVRICQGWRSSTAASNQCWDDALIRIYYYTRITCSPGSLTVNGPTRLSGWSSFGQHSKATCPTGRYRTSSSIISWRAAG